MTELIQKDCRDIKRKLAVMQSTQGINVCLVAVAKNEDANILLTIPCQGEALASEYCYDAVRDLFLVEGIDWTELGEVPVSYILVLDDATGWETAIPLPPSVIKRYLSKEQKKKLAEYRSRFDSKEYFIEFIQCLKVY